MTVMTKLAESGNLTAEQQSRIQRDADQFDQALQDPAFLKEAADVLGEGKGIWDRLKGMFAQQAPGAAFQAAAMGLGGVAVAGGKMGYDALIAKLHKQKAFNAMMEANPELSNEDPNRVQRVFDSLFRFNPAYARDPQVAGTFVSIETASEKPMALNTINALVSSHSQLQGKGNSPFSAGADFFSKAVPKVPWADPEEQAHRREQHAHQLEESKHKAEGAGLRTSADREAFLADQQNRKNMEEAFRGEEAKRKFWEGAEAVSPEDPRAAK